MNQTLSESFFKTEQEGILTYRYYIPENISSDKKYPMLIFMHGAGERGNDSRHLRYKDQVNFFEKILENDELRENFILFAPQCPEGMQWVNHPWTTGTYVFSETPQSEPSKIAASLLFGKFLKDYPVDKDRIYITGISMGGYGTWDMLARYPDTFAAAVPVCGGVDERLSHVYRNIPLWICHGYDDDTVHVYGDRHIFARLVLEDAADVHYSEYPDSGHAAWTPAYNDDRIFKWMLSHTRKASE